LGPAMGGEIWQNGTRNLEPPIEWAPISFAAIQCILFLAPVLIQFDDIRCLKSRSRRPARRSCSGGVPRQFILGDGPVLNPEVVGFLIGGHDGTYGYR